MPDFLIALATYSFKDRVAGDPLSFYAACFVMIPVAIWVYSMIGWSITQDIDPWFGIPAAAVGLGLGMATISPPAPGLGPLFFAAAVLMMVSYPFVRNAAKAKMVSDIQIHEMTRAYEALRQRPDHASAQLKLAESLYQRGYVDHALAVGGAAIKKLDPKYFIAEHRMVAQWAQHASGGAPDQIRCLSCGVLNDPANVFCIRCREPYLLYHARGRWVAGAKVAPILGFWIVGMLAAVGIPTVALMPIPLEIRIGLIVLVVAAAGFALVKSLGRLHRSEAG